MNPGLYRVVTHFCVAGFVVDPDGIIRRCAPILYKRLEHWKTVAAFMST